MSTNPDLPKFFADDAGFCYVATDHLAAQPGLTPWNGAVDAAGFATEVAGQVAEPAAAEQPRRANKARK